MAADLPARGMELRELSSAGSEHLPYKQRVGGSNPSAPTVKIKQLLEWLLFLCRVLPFLMNAA